MTRWWLGCLLAVVVGGCGGGGDGVTGRWTGTLTEGEKPAAVEFELADRDGEVVGALSILQDMPPDVKKGHKGVVAKGKLAGESLSFELDIFPGSGEKPYLVTLQRKGDVLAGEAVQIGKPAGWRPVKIELRAQR